MKRYLRQAGYFAREAIIEIVLVALCIFLAIRADGFLSVGNFLNILRNVSLQGIIALGMTMVIIAGEIDLSVGSAVAFSGCLTLWTWNHLTHGPGWPLSVLTFAIAVATGATVTAATGAFSGVMRVRFGVPTFISTLAWMTILQGLAGIISNGFPMTEFPDWFSQVGHGAIFKTAHFDGIPVQAILFVGIFLILQLTMNYTSFGRSVYAVGGNAEAARLSGISVGFIKIAVMAIVAALAGLAGIVEASRINRGSHDAGLGWELEIIAAVIVGGTSLMGGAGRIWGTLVGVLFLGVVENGMTMMEITNDYWKYVVRGGIIFIAVLLNVAIPKKRH